MELLFILVLILLNGIFSMSEIALVSSKKVRLEAALKAGKKGAQTALNLSESPTRLLSTVQIGITLIGLLTGIYSGENITNNLEAWLHQFELLRPVANGMSVAIVLVSITYCSLVLGELVPKRIGLANPEAISMRVAPLMKFLSSIAYPFVWALTKTSDLILRILGVKISSRSSVTEEEIKAIIQEGTQGGEIQQIEQKIVERVFSLGDRKISSLMTTRNDLVFINVADQFESIRATINKDLHRIYPVYENDKDKILGVVMLKDLFVNIQFGDFHIQNSLKPAHFLSEHTSAYKALEKFKTSEVHYALVTNEYGLVLGIVTMDDILKALIGDAAAFYTEDYQLSQRPDGSWLVDGGFPMAEFIMHFDLEDSQDIRGVNTVAGLILNRLNHIPVTGEKVQWKGLELEVMDMDNIKIDKVLIKKI
jgi:putative hemolysin